MDLRFSDLVIFDHIALVIELESTWRLSYLRLETEHVIPRVEVGGSPLSSHGRVVLRDLR
jgi:hypothetical protein